MKTPTPGYNSRLAIYFTTTAAGQRQAYRFSYPQMRAFRMKLAEAEMLVAQDLATEIAGNPMRVGTFERVGR